VGGDVSGAGGLANGQFNPSDFFGSAFSAAKLFGGVLLTDILKLAGLGDVPSITRSKLPDKIVINFNWSTTQLQSDPLGLFVPSGINGGTASLTITATITINIPLNGTPSAPTYDIEGDLSTFQINMFEFIIIGFDDFTFSAKTGKKVDVNPTISNNGIVFGGPLTFINELKNFIPDTGFGDPPILDVEPTGVTAGYKLAIPSIGIGVFALEHISLTAELTIPFTGKPIRFRFAFCEKEHPFTLSVSIFGGGGYFGIALGIDGVESLEAALEFGGNFSFDIGIASGGVHLMAGIYFKWENKATTLTAYIRLGGSVDVLGLISISVEFYLALSYCSDGTLSGEASLKVDIHILFFSVSVTLSVHKTITKGSGVGHVGLIANAGETGAAPTVVDLIPDQATWNLYADAFA
jgi:hypothetical protein